MPGIPLVHKSIVRASGDLVLFDKNSVEARSAVVDVTDYSYLVQAYGLRYNEKITVVSVYAIGLTNRETIFKYNSKDIILTSENPTALLAISGRYRFIFEGILGNLTLVCLAQNDIIKSGIVAKNVGDKTPPNALLNEKSTSKITAKVQIRDKPWVFTAFGLQVGEYIKVKSVYNGVAEDYTLGGTLITLTPDNTNIVLDRSGDYNFELVGDLGDVVLICRPNYVSYTDPYLTSGPEGPPGPTGPSGGGYNFIQPTPTLTWTINHNLGYYPSVELLTVGGMEFESDVLHLNTNTVFVNNKLPIAGKARLS